MCQKKKKKRHNCYKDLFMIFLIKVLKNAVICWKYTYVYLYFFTYYNGNKYYINTIENVKTNRLQIIIKNIKCTFLCKITVSAYFYKIYHQIYYLCRSDHLVDPLNKNFLYLF